MGGTKKEEKTCPHHMGSPVGESGDSVGQGELLQKPWTLETS